MGSSTRTRVQVDLGDEWVGPCLAALSRLTSLDLRGGVFAPSAAHLRAALLAGGPGGGGGGMGEGLASLTLHFGSEWWMHAGERQQPLRAFNSSPWPGKKAWERLPPCPWVRKPDSARKAWRLPEARARPAWALCAPPSPCRRAGGRF